MHDAIKKRYDTLAPYVMDALKKRHFEAYYCQSKEDVLPLVLSMIPKDHTVSFAGSETVRELGVIDAIKQNGYTVIDRYTAKTQEERQELMRAALLCDTFLTSSNAIGADGVLVNIDGNGNRVAAMTYGPRSVIVIAGMNKVVHDRNEAYLRARHTAAPMNIQRFPGTETPCMKNGVCADCKSDMCICSYIVETRMCRPAGRIKVILVGEDLGF